ncbi:MAG TPA: CARDB domain-containing protein, partial [Candidatus Binatia bacterium]|nr:CARDB domain-containing protein [Candidatus Binatia bacterium]
ATTTSIATTSTTVTTTTSSTHTTTTTAATSTTVPTTTTTRPTTSTTTTTATTTSIATTSTTATTSTSTTHTTTTSATTSTTVPGTPDLVPTDFTGPATGAAGGQITVSFTVKNQGTASASPTWTDQLVFSSDTAIGGDTVLSNVAHTTAVAANATYSASRTPTLPNVPPGTYYLLLRVDLLNQVAEGAGESNNVAAAIPIVVQTPDLVPTALTAADGDAGHAIAVSFTVKNQGDVSASPNWVDQLWLSTDQAFGGDTQLATVSHTTALAPDATYDVTRNPTLPEVPPGTYYVLLRTDSTGQVYEGGADANNDAAPVAITIHTPDLVPTEIDAPATATHGTQITITFTVENQGAATADPNWNDQLWLSTDQTLGGDTLLTNSAHTTGLSAGASYGTVKMPTLPNVTGSYYLLVHTDSADQVYEGGADGNNVLAVPITIQ